jgi:hypothetical protein
MAKPSRNSVLQLPRPACSLPDRDSGRATLGQDGGCLNGTSIEADRAGDTSHDNTDLAALALDGVAENQGRQAGLCRSVGRRGQGKWRSGDDSDGVAAGSSPGMSLIASVTTRDG